MKELIPVMLAVLALSACNSGENEKSSSWDGATCPEGYEVCGEQCMSAGNSCCPDDSLSCSAGTLCNPANVCVSSEGDQTGCNAGYERCNDFGCMPAGATCCEKEGGASVYCQSGYACVADDKCQGDGGAPATSVPVANVVVTTARSDASTSSACGDCILTEKTCSQWVALGTCSIQSCTCYDASGISQLWYQTGSADHVTGCYQCTGTTAASCESAAQAATNACT